VTSVEGEGRVAGVTGERGSGEAGKRVAAYRDPVTRNIFHEKVFCSEEILVTTTASV
jgi:hypothetical protein